MAERQILVQDAERLREELASVVRERDGWRLRSEASSSDGYAGAGEGGGGGGDDDHGERGGGTAADRTRLAEYMIERRAYEAEIAELSNACNALREELRSREDVASEERRCAVVS